MLPQDDGDEYQSLCLRAKPDHGTDIRRVFAETPAGPAIARRMTSPKSGGPSH